MLSRKAQRNLPKVWQLPQISDQEWQAITAMFIVALTAEIVALAMFVSVVAWPTISARLTPLPPPAIVVEPIAPVAQPMIVEVAPAPKTIPLTQVKWEIVPSAPYASALMVKDDILYIIQNRPGGYLAWHQENDKWVSRLATSAEEALTYDFHWQERYPWITEVLGDPPGITWVKGNQQAFIATRGAVGDDLRFLPRIFLKTEKGWVEIPAPADGKGYGLVAIGNELFVAIGDSLWQAKLKNLL
jgi:hypothetical protein